MNTFKNGDVVSRSYGNNRVVSYIQGPYVYFKGGDYANYQECTLVQEPKFKPGDVVSNGYKEFTIRCAKSEIGDAVFGIAYDYTEGGFDFESGLTLIRSAVPIIDLIKAGKMIEAIKQHRIIYGSGLKEAKDAIEALEREQNQGATLGDILGTALKSREQKKFKTGDRVKLNHSFYYDVTGTFRCYTYEGTRAHVNWDNGQGNSFDCLVSSMVLVEPSTPSIVILKNKNGLAPSATPLVHDTRELAETEARRLAVKHPGSEFVVFTIASTSSAPKPVTPVATTVTA